MLFSGIGGKKRSVCIYEPLCLSPCLFIDSLFMYLLDFYLCLSGSL